MGCSQQGFQVNSDLGYNKFILQSDKQSARGRKNMNEKERLNALEVALNNEMREHEFYVKNAKRTKNVLGKTG
jgi:hypothetical protein